MSIPLLVAAGAPVQAVLLSFGFYLLNVLVPIIPAVIIYWLFPEGKTGSGGSVEGTVGGWKIKAVGAWGAYVTAFLLGFWAINTTAIPLIKAVGGASVWTIDSNFKFTDENGKEISDSTDKLQVEPPKVQPWGKHADITVFSETLDPPEKIKLKLDGYDYQVVDLTKCTAKNGRIMTPEIILKRLPPLATGPAPTPLPVGVGPPAIAANK